MGNIAEDLLICGSVRSHTIVMVELKLDGAGVIGIIQEVCAYPIHMHKLSLYESWTMINMYRFLLH